MLRLQEVWLQEKRTLWKLKQALSVLSFKKQAKHIIQARFKVENTDYYLVQYI